MDHHQPLERKLVHVRPNGTVRSADSVFDAKEGRLSAQSLAPGVYLVRRDVQGQRGLRRDPFAMGEGRRPLIGFRRVRG